MLVDSPNVGSTGRLPSIALNTVFIIANTTYTQSVEKNYYFYIHKERTILLLSLVFMIFNYLLGRTGDR